MGRAIDMYWSQKRTLAPGSEPQFVRELMDRMAPYVYGQSLAGAGGGGFYFALLKENSDRTLIEDIVFSVKVCFFVPYNLLIKIIINDKTIYYLGN